MKIKTQRIISLDLVKFCAIFMVVALHVASLWIYKIPPASSLSSWLGANFFNSFGRLCVALFFMVSGALLLTPSRQKEPTSVFLKKHLLPTLVIYIVWQLIYFFWIRRFDPFLATLVNFTHLKTWLDLILTPSYYLLWYLQALIWIYLITPFLRQWLQIAQKKDILYALLIWGIFIIGGGLLSWLSQGSIRHLSYVVEYGGFYLAGFYFFHFRSQTHRAQIIAWTTYLIASLVIFFFTWFTSLPQGHFQGYAYDYLSLPAVITALGLFVAIINKDWQKLPSQHPFFTKLILLLSSLTLGIYLIHVIVFETIRQLLTDQLLTSWNSWLFIPLGTIVVLALSAILTFIWRKIPLLKRLV